MIKMTQYLPPNLLALFAARPPLKYLPPTRKLPHEQQNRQFGLLSDYKGKFEDPKNAKPPPKIETKLERRERRKLEKLEIHNQKVREQAAKWNPNDNPNATHDPKKTLFVARLNYDTSESKLKREFEAYGPIEKIIIVQDKIKNGPRGYAFIEYRNRDDMHEAYKRADGKRIDGRRVLVDFERGRTRNTKGWVPRRLGGGMGGRKEKTEKSN